MNKECGFQMEKLTGNMIRWAKSKLGSTAYAKWCPDFAEDALEQSNDIEIFGGDSAKESCEMYKDTLQTGIPERGAFVFYDCLCPRENGPVNWGLCSFSSLSACFIQRGHQKSTRKAASQSILKLR